MERLSSRRHIVGWASGIGERVFESIEVVKVVGGNEWQRCEAAYTITNSKKKQKSFVSLVLDLCPERVLSRMCLPPCPMEDADQGKEFY